MQIDQAVKEKINKILIEKNITINKLASLSCLTQSTVDSLVNGKSKNHKLLIIDRICDGLYISLSDFLSDEVFNDISRED